MTGAVFTIRNLLGFLLHLVIALNRFTANSKSACLVCAFSGNRFRSCLLLPIQTTAFTASMPYLACLCHMWHILEARGLPARDL